MAHSDREGQIHQPVLNIGSEQLEHIDGELEAALKHLKNRKTPGENQIISEMLKTGGETLRKALLTLLNKCREEEKIPDFWKNANVLSLFYYSNKATAQIWRISGPSVCYQHPTAHGLRLLPEGFQFNQNLGGAGGDE